LERSGLGRWATRDEIAICPQGLRYGFRQAPAGGSEVIVADQHVDPAGGDRSSACPQREVRGHVEDEVVATPAAGEVLARVVHHVVCARRAEQLQLVGASTAVTPAPAAFASCTTMLPNPPAAFGNGGIHASASAARRFGIPLADMEFICWKGLASDPALFAAEGNKLQGHGVMGCVKIGTRVS
jgi:hypothetical protein